MKQQISKKQFYKGIVAGVCSIAVLFGMQAMENGINNSAAEESAQAGVVEVGTGSTFEGTAAGRNGDITVAVTLDGAGVITNIQTIASTETEGIGDIAIETLTGEILSNQSIAVDTISGATLSSEGFLGAVEAALTAGGYELASYKGEVVKEAGEDLELEADVVIIGGGGAGMAAAVSASDAGASVIVLEKMSSIGGNTRLGEGTYNVADPDMLESTGAKTNASLEAEIEAELAVETDDEDYKALIAAVQADYDAWKESGTDTLFDSANWHALQTYTGGGNIGNLKLIETYATNAMDTYKWLVNDMDVPFKTDYIFMAIGGKWQRGHQIDLIAATGKEGDSGGAVYISRLEEHAVANGTEIYTDAKVTTLLVDDSGRVCGAEAERSDGSKITVNAKAVILATGGYAANSDLVYKYSNGAITTTMTSCAVSSTGDGLELAEAVGGNLIDLDQIQVHPLGDPINDCGCVAQFVGNWLSAQYYMFVNKEGERFVKEDGTRYEMSMAELEQTDDQMWLIVDSSQIAGDDNRTEQIESLIADGHTYRGETLADLAEQIGIDADVLQATVDKYNEGMRNGVDEFGKAASAESVIEVGPFYASLRTPTVHHTMGGVQINTDTQVLDANGNPIPGLYAAGEVTSGVHGNNRLGGNAYSDIMTYGRIAGKNAATK